MRNRAITLLLVLLTFARLSVAADGPEAKQQERAFDLVKAAIAFQDEGRHDLALDPLNEALTLFKHPKILFYKARSLTAMERWQEAYDMWDRLMGSNDLKEDQRDEVRQGWVRTKAALEESAPQEVVAIPKEAPSVAVIPPSSPPPAEARVEAPNDLSGNVDVKEQRSGLSTTTWVLIGTGAAAVVGGGLAAFFLLRDSGPGAAEDKWVVR